MPIREEKYMKFYSKSFGRKISKRLITALLVVGMVCTTAHFEHSMPVYAAEQIGVVTTKYASSTVNVRKTASLSATILCELTKGTEVTILSETTGSDGNKWYQVTCTHPTKNTTVTGYMSADYVEIKENENDDAESALVESGTINANDVYVRESAGTTGTYILSLNKGDTVTISGQTSVNGVIWYHVSGKKDGQTFDGYSCGTYIDITSSSSGDSDESEVSDSDYKATLKKAGFPDSYIPYLTALHVQYPKWVFQAVETGLDWETVIKNESKKGVNVVSKSSDDSMKSTESGCYDWTTNEYTIIDSSTWVTASSGIIAYYMDPRNFLDATNIFQFEALSYSESQSLEGVKTIVANTYLASSVKDSDGKTLNYPKTLMSIGESTGVSPYHLAARLIQEQGTKGTSPMISGTYSGYEGYYNYFNYGASGSTTTAVLVSGLKYAKNQGWNSRYKSISGGATLLGKNYINRGQDTLYFEKFNVVYKAGLYSHQYMQNLMAAYSEGRKMATAYTDKKQAFVFRIPVYKNMPSSAVTFTKTGNPNNYLKTLKVSGHSLTPSFAGKTTSYSMVVDNSVSSITVSASAVASTSKVTGTGKYSLSVGTNKISIKCKSQSGSTKTYTITVVRSAANDSDEEYSVSSSKYSIGSTYVTGIAVGTKAATFVKNISATNCTVKLLTSSGTENTDTVATGNKVAVYVDGKQVKTYTVVIYGDINGDGKISVTDMARLYRYMNGKVSLSACYRAAADVNRDGKEAKVTDMARLYNYLNGKASIKQ